MVFIAFVISDQMRLRSIIISDNYNGLYWNLKNKLKKYFFEQHDFVFEQNRFLKRCKQYNSYNFNISLNAHKRKNTYFCLVELSYLLLILFPCSSISDNNIQITVNIFKGKYC